MVKPFKFFNKPVLKVENLHPAEIGATGTKNYQGYYDEEYLQKIRDLDGIDLYDEMRRSDGQVKMLLSVIKNPILSASWGVESVDDSEEESEIAAFAEHILFNDIGYPDGTKSKTFRGFLKEALTMVEFGHSVFEIVHKVVLDHPRFGNYTGLADLSWRSPKTIYEWHVSRNGSLSHIRQMTATSPHVDVNIPAKFLLVLTNDLEGSNFQGISALRPIYGNHYRKTYYRKFQAMGIERCALGVPVGTIDDQLRNTSNFAEQFKSFKNMLKRYASNQDNYMVLEKGFSVSELKLSHDPEKVQMAIDGENIEMTKAFLANFMELGLNGSGSFALGTDLSDLFLSNLQGLADEIAECLNRKVLKNLIRAKYGEREHYPKIIVTAINDKAGKEFAEIIKLLIDAGAIKNSDRLENHIHKIYKLPDIVREQEASPDDAEDRPDLTQDSDSPQNPTLSSTESDSFPLPASVRKNAKTALKLLKSNKGAFLDLHEIERANQLSETQSITLDDLKRIAAYDRNRHKYKPEIKNDDGSPTQETLAWLAFGGDDGIEWAKETLKNYNIALAEKKKTPAEIQIERDSIELAKIFRENLKDNSKDFRKAILQSLDKKASRDVLFSLKMPNIKGYQKQIESFLIDVSDTAQKEVFKELSTSKKLASIKDLPKATQKRLLAEIALIAATHYADIERLSYFFLNGRIDTDQDSSAVVEELERLQVDHIDKSIYDVGALNAVSGAVNGVRNDVFQAPDVMEEIESFVFVNPDPKSPICKHLAGRVFSKEEYANSGFLPPLHHNCKSTIRAQTKGDKDNLPISPEGLSITAAGDDMDKIMKSKQFTECNHE